MYTNVQFISSMVNNRGTSASAPRLCDALPRIHLRPSATGEQRFVDEFGRGSALVDSDQVPGNAWQTPYQLGLWDGYERDITRYNKQQKEQKWSVVGCLAAFSGLLQI